MFCLTLRHSTKNSVTAAKKCHAGYVVSVWSWDDLTLYLNLWSVLMIIIFTIWYNISNVRCSFSKMRWSYQPFVLLQCSKVGCQSKSTCPQDLTSLPVILSFFASILSFSFILTGFAFFSLLIHTFCFSHSCHTLSPPLFFLPKAGFFSFFTHTGISLFLVSPTSVFLYISVPFSQICCDGAFNLTRLSVSAWYAALYSHTRCST